MMIESSTSNLWQFLQSNPFLGVLITCVVYYLAQLIFRQANQKPFLNPVLISILVIIGLLLYFEVDYQKYFVGGQLIHYFLGPATVALAWPLYKHLNLIKNIWLPITITIVAGILIGASSAIWLAQLFDASLVTQLSLAPKSVTTPVAIAVVEKIGGLPALTAGFVIITGVMGAMFGSTLFKWMGIHDEKVKGIAMGVSAHGVGTARALQISAVMGAFSGLAMALSALLMGFILPPWLKLLGII